MATYLQLNKKVQFWVLLSRTTSSLPNTWRTKSRKRTLQFRRDKAIMLQVFKNILNGYEDIDSSRFFTLSSTGLRGHSLFLFLFQYSTGPFYGISLKLFKERNRLLLRKQTFTQRVVDSWNNFPKNVVNAPSINAYKSRFKTHTRGAAPKFCPTWYMPTIHIQRSQMRTRAN